MTDLATLLWNARITGGTIDPASVAPPATPEEAYSVQERIVALSGDRVVGFKVGSTSIEAQRMLGTDEPGAGALLERFVLSSPAVVKIAPSHQPCVEGEFAFRMRADLPSRGAAYTREEVAAAVGAVGGAIEVVGSRFAGGLRGQGRLRTTADGGVNIALALGDWRDAPPLPDLREFPVSMRINGEQRGQGKGSRALGDPMNVLVWLANRQSRVGRGLRAGEVVSTGTCTGLDPVRPGDVAEADFGVLGKVEIRFE